MKIKAKINFKDKYTGHRYKAGEVYEVTDERGAEIIATQHGRFAEEVEDQSEEKSSQIEDVELTEKKTADELMELTALELKEMAQEAGIKGYGKMKKAELAEALAE